MANYNELVTHLTNLKKAGNKNVTLEVERLLDVLTSVRVQPKPETIPTKYKTIEVDGGKF